MSAGRGKFFIYHRGQKVAETTNFPALFRTGIRIGGHYAWRLNGKNGPPRGNWCRLGRKRRRKVNFGEHVLVYNPVTGFQAKYARSWYLSFFLRLWVACKWEDMRMAAEAKKLGIDAGIMLIRNNVMSAAKTYWPEVKRQLKGKYGIDVDEQVERVKAMQDFCFSEKVQGVYETDPAKAAPLISIAANIGNRLIETALAVEKKGEQEDKEKHLIEVLAANTKEAVKELKEELRNDTKPGG